MSNFSSFSTMETSNIIWKNVSLTDEIKINLEYNIHQGLLNIFVKNISNNNKLPSQINIISNDEPDICYEISTTYVYDIIDTNENIEEIDFSQTRLSSSSSFTTDNDDGYSTHSFDDIEHQQQLPLVIPPSKLIIPSFSSSYYYSEQYISPIRRIIEQITWLNPFKRTVQEMMMMNHMFV